MERKLDPGLNPKDPGFERGRYLGGEVSTFDRYLLGKNSMGRWWRSRGCRPQPTDVEEEDKSGTRRSREHRICERNVREETGKSGNVGKVQTVKKDSELRPT